MRRLLAAVVAAGVLALPSTAHAFAESQITSPADGFRIAVDDATPPVSVEGSVTAAAAGDKVDIVCLTGAERLVFLAEDVDAASGTFAANVAAATLFPGVCRMHAIPADGDLSTLDLTKYDGPLVTADHDREFRTPAAHASGNVVSDFLVSHTQPRGYTDYYSLGSCGICDMQLFFADTGTSSETVFNGNSWFHWEEDDRNRSYLRIDGRDALTSFGAADIDVDPGPGVAKGSTLPGVPPVSHTATRGAGTDMVLTEDQDLVACEQSSATWPPSACGRWVGTGVHEHRAVRQMRDGTLLLLEDVFTSTDGREHALDLHWDQFFTNPEGAAPPSPAFRFPWAGGAYAAHVEGDLIPAPPVTPASIYVDTNDAEPDGSRRWPHGVIVFDHPAGPPEFFLGQEFVLPMTATVPAGGSVTIRQAYAVATTQAELEELAAGLEDEWGRPSVAFTAPAEGAVVTQSAVDVTGTAGDSRGLAAIQLDGHDVPVAPDGTWRRTVTLTPGENTLTAVARDGAGNEASATRRVVYIPPPQLLDLLAPILSEVSLTNRRFALAPRPTAVSAAAKRGTRVRYTLSEAATVTFRVRRVRPGRRVAGRCRAPSRRLRRRPRCKRYVRAGPALRRSSPAGRSSLRFSGRIGRRALRKGRYRMRIRAVDAAGNRSGARRLRFRIVRR